MTTPPIKPHIPAEKSLPELTPGVVVLGAVLSVAFAAANAYLGMFAGITVTASIPATVVSTGILRGLRTGNILQNNAVQVAATSGDGIASGAIFTLPALLFVTYWSEFPLLQTAVLVGVGGVLGVLFTSPFRRALIKDQPFPEAMATAEVLRVAARGTRELILAAAVSAVVKLGNGLGLWTSLARVTGWIGRPVDRGVPLSLGIDGSPALISVGYVLGLNVAVVVFAGGAVNHFVLIPLWAGVIDRVQGELLAPVGAGDIADAYHRFTRYAGVGALLVAALWPLLRFRGAVASVFRAVRDAPIRRSQSGDAILRTERDISIRAIVATAALATLLLSLVVWQFSGSLTIALMTLGLMPVAGFAFSLLAAHAAGLVGSSNTPTTGIAILAALTTALVLVALGFAGPRGVAVTIALAAVVSCAASVGGANLDALRTGQLVGATPWRQQTMQLIGVVAAALAIVPILNLLNGAYQIGSNRLSAPQAHVVSAVTSAVFDRQLPWGILATGASLGVAVIVVGRLLARNEVRIRVPVPAFAIGLYLPFELVTPILCGGIIRWFVERTLERANVSYDQRQRVEHRGLLAATGFIAGESLMGIALAIPVTVSRDPSLLVLFGGRFSGFPIPSLIVVVTVMALLYQLALNRGQRDGLSG